MSEGEIQEGYNSSRDALEVISRKYCVRCHIQEGEVLCDCNCAYCMECSKTLGEEEKPCLICDKLVWVYKRKYKIEGWEIARNRYYFLLDIVSVIVDIILFAYSYEYGIEGETLYSLLFGSAGVLDGVYICTQVYRNIRKNMKHVWYKTPS